jgi:hypothetical protein
MFSRHATHRPRSKTDIGMFMLSIINTACCLDLRRGGSGPRSDPPPDAHNGTGLVGTWQLRRRSQGRMNLDARQSIPSQEGIRYRRSLGTDLGIDWWCRSERCATCRSGRSLGQSNRLRWARVRNRYRRCWGCCYYWQGTSRNTCPARLRPYAGGPSSTRGWHRRWRKQRPNRQC